MNSYFPILLSLLGVSLSTGVHAGVILSPIGATTTSIDGGTTPPMGSLVGFDPVRTIDQSGLSTPYESLVTDFDTYIAGAPTHDSIHASLGDTSSWISDLGRTVGFFDFDLGSTYTIESFVLWNYGGANPQNVGIFDLEVADNPDFTGATAIPHDPTLVNTGPSDAVLPQVFEFDTPTEGRYVRMFVIDNFGSQDFTSFGEAAFEVAIPEISTTILSAIGLLGLGLRRRRA